MAKSRLDDTQLLESLQRVGVLAPGIKWHGVLLDGRRRARLCAQVGMHFPCNDFTSFRDVAVALWLVEPERCVQRFGLSRGTEAFAKLVGVRRGQVAAFFPRRPPVVSPKVEQCETVSFRIPSALRVAIDDYAEKHGLTFSQVFRSACLLQLQRQRAQQRYQKRSLGPVPAAEQTKPDPDTGSSA